MPRREKGTRASASTARQRGVLPGGPGQGQGLGSSPWARSECGLGGIVGIILVLSGDTESPAGGGWVWVVPRAGGEQGSGALGEQQCVGRPGGSGLLMGHRAGEERVPCAEPGRASGWAWAWAGCEEVPRALGWEWPSRAGAGHPPAQPSAACGERRDPALPRDSAEGRGLTPRCLGLGPRQGTAHSHSAGARWSPNLPHVCV